MTGFAAEGFPTTPGAYDTTFSGSAACCDEGRYGDAYVTKLSRDGSRLLYSTFVGGAGIEQANALALGRDGSVVITAARDRIVDYIGRGEGDIVVDGRTIETDGDGFWVGPTLIDNVTPDKEASACSSRPKQRSRPATRPAASRPRRG